MWRFVLPGAGVVGMTLLLLAGSLGTDRAEAAVRPCRPAGLDGVTACAPAAFSAYACVAGDTGHSIPALASVALAIVSAGSHAAGAHPRPGRI
jgi:hypothetical protein